jgi:hypothetical protein
MDEEKERDVPRNHLSIYIYKNNSSRGFGKDHPYNMIASLQVEEVYQLKAGWQHEDSLCVKMKYDGETHFIVFGRRTRSHQDPSGWDDLQREAQIDKSAQVVLDRYKDLLQASIREGSTVIPSLASTCLKSLLDWVSVSPSTQAVNIADPIRVVQTNANDRVWTIDERTFNQRKIGNGIKAKISLYDVAILAAVVHKQNPIYSLLQRPCYWYCNLIYSVLEKRFKPQSTLFLDQPQGNQSEAIIDPKYERWWRIRNIDIKECLVAFIDEKFDLGKLEAQEAVGPLPKYLLQNIDNPSVYPISQEIDSFASKNCKWRLLRSLCITCNAVSQSALQFTTKAPKMKS